MYRGEREREREREKLSMSDDPEINLYLTKKKQYINK